MTSLTLLLAALCVLFSVVFAEPSRYKITFTNEIDSEPRTFVRFFVMRAIVNGFCATPIEQWIPANPDSNNVLELEESNEEDVVLFEIKAFYSDHDYITVHRDEIIRSGSPNDEVRLVNLKYNQKSAYNEAAAKAPKLYRKRG